MNDDAVEIEVRAGVRLFVCVRACVPVFISSFASLFHFGDP